MTEPLVHGGTGPDDPTGIAVSTLRIADPLVLCAGPGEEIALVVLSGAGAIEAGETRLAFARPDWIDTGPSAIHLGPGATATLRPASAGCEALLVSTANPVPFPARVFGPEDCRHEDRGRGRLEDTAHRIVRTVFDRENAPAEARLVVGEVVNLPGRWSSYPPHHHPQPEVYCYRFHPRHGYGHAEMGDRVYRVRDGDCLRILPGHDHAQCAAPGYHMYYLWAIRHLDEAPYTGFEYARAHAALGG